MKRLFDISASFIGLLLLSPILIALAIWIKLDSRGPVFFKQIRVGKGGKDFKILKFRSMYLDSEKSGQITVGDRDPRVTKSGYYIRKYKFDEIPQLFNVLKGEMSIVGPRPEVRRYVNLYTKDQMQILSVRPGITDPASIKYRNENEILEKVEDPEDYYIKVIMQDKIRYNLEYIENKSFHYDIKLIIRTFKAIVE